MKASFMFLPVLFLVVLIACQVPTATAGVPPRPVINSRWTGSPPSIDGVFTEGEWSNPQIFLTSPSYPIDAYVYFLNDNSNLYVMVDAVGDVTDDASDECLMVFGFSASDPHYQVLVRIEGTSASYSKSSNDFDAAVGFGVSPNSPSSHKIYEFSIPFSYINAEPGQPIDFCAPAIGIKGSSMPYDGSQPPRDNVWPYYLDMENIETWGILNQGQLRPVGGILTPVNKFTILAPYLALLGLVGVVTVAAATKRRRKP